MFIGRKNELNSLNNSYNKGSFQFPVIYGRRRVGKTTLIKEFCKDKKFIYFVAIQSTLKENLAILSAQILAALVPNSPSNPFSSFREAIKYVFECAKTEQFVFVIDEYPYLAASDISVSSVLQAAIDEYQGASNLFLILCGSSMSFMENQVLGYKSPLYGRRTAQYKLLPFDYLDSAGMLLGFTNEEKIILYGITSGIPEYLARIDNTLSMKANIINQLFDASGRLFEEPTNLLKQELRTPETYNAIISAIAGGSSKLNEIATKVGIETSQCSKMLSSLIGLGLVRKEYPITASHSKRSIYILDDWMFIFWYRFVQPDLSRIIGGFGEKVFDEAFNGQLSSHIGFVFEECARQYMWRAMETDLVPMHFKKIGRWWGTNHVEKREEEIDFIAISDDNAIFGECKWRNTQIGEETLADIKRKSNLFSEFAHKELYLFSKSGFTSELNNRSKREGNITLIGVDDMFMRIGE